MRYPNLSEEKKLWKRGCKKVVGLDEAGRGPLAGPVVAAAVMLNLKIKNQKSKLQFKIQKFKIKDSKKLTKKQREEFYKLITEHPAIGWGIGRVSEKMIDKINILEATKLAMKKAVGMLEKRLNNQSNIFSHGREKRCNKGGVVNFLIIDGKMKLNLPIAQKSIIKADEKVFSCAAASILAKVARDGIMEKYHKKYPKYRFDIHKGYPTKLHSRLLKKYGPCCLHRKSFSPVKILVK